MSSIKYLKKKLDIGGINMSKHSGYIYNILKDEYVYNAIEEDIIISHNSESDKLINIGCQYCRGEKKIPLYTDLGSTWIEDNKIVNAYSEAVINYCPMCGRILSNK
jgi:hypothetical protein